MTTSYWVEVSKALHDAVAAGPMLTSAGLEVLDVFQYGPQTVFYKVFDIAAPAELEGKNVILVLEEGLADANACPPTYYYRITSREVRDI